MTAVARSNRETEFFFAFVDGAYDYVCAECTALCCKGHGLGGSLERELRPLFAKYPQLETMAMLRTGDQVTLATTSGGCVMLDSDNFCRIEKDLGKEKKPNICNLFPFNSFAKIGQTIVVMPHFLCPLRTVVPARPGEVRGTHSFIENDLRTSQMLNKAYIKSSVGPARWHASLTEVEAIERERKFRERSARALGVEKFSDVLMAASTDASGFAAFRRRAWSILGYESPNQSNARDALDDHLLAFASPYRIGLLDLPEEGVLRALAVGELIARRAWSGATITPSFQAIANTVAAFRPIQTLLAHGDEPFDFGRVTKKAFSFDDAELTFSAFVSVQQSVEKGILGTLEEAITPTMPIADRAVLLRRLGEQMAAVKSKQTRRNGTVIEKILSSQDRGQVSQMASRLN